MRVAGQIPILFLRFWVKVERIVSASQFLRQSASWRLFVTHHLLQILLAHAVFWQLAYPCFYICLYTKKKILLDELISGGIAKQVKKIRVPALRNSALYDSSPTAWSHGWNVPRNRKQLHVCRISDSHEWVDKKYREDQHLMQKEW